MRKKILTVAAAGVLGVSSLAVAGPALAAVGADGAAATVTSRVDGIKQALSGLVTDGTLTQAQADKVAATLDSSDALRRHGHDGGPGGPGGYSGPGGRGGRNLSAAATALGLSQADLRTALEGGKSLAQVAKDKGVAVGTVVTALVDAEKARIAQAVKDGRLPQADADERLADLTARVTDRVNGVRPARPMHDRPAPDAPAAPAPVPTS